MSQQPASSEQSNKPRQKRRDDFNIVCEIGRGAFGQVLKVSDKETQKEYAMKVLSKAHIVKEKKMNYVKLERDVMTKLNHPNVIKMLLCFQDPGNLYYVTELAVNSDLQKVLNNIGTLNIPIVKILMGQLLLAIAHMHKNRVIHRDLKPENILLDGKNRVKVTDFGTAKMFTNDEPFQAQRGSFVGSADFVPPETLIETPIGPSSDLWSYGCILYNLIVGVPPFHSKTQFETFQLIQDLKYSIPGFVPLSAAELIKALLKIDPSERLGHGEYERDYESIRNHPFFQDIDWDTLTSTEVPAWEPFPGAPKQSEPKDEEAEAAPSKPPPPTEIIDEEATSKYQELLEPNEKVLFIGNIVKRKGLSSKKRKLILTTKPRLFYIDDDKNKKELMGEIPLSGETTVEIKTSKKWNVNVPNRVYSLEAGNPQEWKEAIDSVLQRLK